jgi:hypothetical protein
LRDLLHTRLKILAAAVGVALSVAPAAAENAGAPRMIETRPLKLIGDGTAPRPSDGPSAPGASTIATPPLRLIGDRGSAPAPERAPPRAITVETRPLKLIGAKP